MNVLMSHSFMFIIEHMMPLCMTVSWIYTTQWIEIYPKNRVIPLMEQLGPDRYVSVQKKKQLKDNGIKIPDAWMFTLSTQLAPLA